MNNQNYFLLIFTITNFEAYFLNSLKIENYVTDKHHLDISN
jgi:hypothetical protein